MRRFLIAGLYATWLLVPLLVLAGGYSNGGGIDGPCLGTTEWTDRAPEGSHVRSETRWLPPGERCIVDGPGGYRAARVFPGNGTWLCVLVLVLTPFALWPVVRRLASEAQINRHKPG